MANENSSVVEEMIEYLIMIWFFITADVNTIENTTGNRTQFHLINCWLGCKAAKYANITNMPPT